MCELRLVDSFKKPYVSWVSARVPCDDAVALEQLYLLVKAQLVQIPEILEHFHGEVVSANLDENLVFFENSTLVDNSKKHTAVLDHDSRFLLQAHEGAELH